MTPPSCPECGQPTSTALAGPEHGYECRNEACPAFGQLVAGVPEDTPPAMGDDPSSR